MPIPNKKHLNHLKNKTVDRFVGWMVNNVRYKRINTYIIALVLLVASIIGIYQIRISGSILEDMPQKKEFFKDILFFDQEFNGIVPLEILIDTKRKNGVVKLPHAQADGCTRKEHRGNSRTLFTAFSSKML